MPKDRDPLHQTEIDLIKKWIAEGATNDTPANAKRRFDMDHPPVYTRPPVITSMDYAPDGTLLAIAGFHEVLLCNADGSKLVARLVLGRQNHLFEARPHLLGQPSAADEVGSARAPPKSVALTGMLLCC